jgi:hypothetical protein
MSSDIASSKLRSWAEEGLRLFRELLPLTTPVATYAGWKPEELETLRGILTACARSSESAFPLVAFAQLWEAEVLVRSIWEGSLKLCFMLQNRECFEVRHREYADDAFRIALYKDHKKAADLLSVLADPEARRWQPIRALLLPPREIQEIEESYPPSYRRSLESRWGFAGLIGALSRSGDPLFEGFGGFAHQYSMSSHIQHMDYVGTSIAVDRERRSSERKNAVALAHGVRLLSDLVTAFILRLRVGYRFVGADPTPLRSAIDKLKRLEESFGAVQDEWVEVEFPRATSTIE